MADNLNFKCGSLLGNHLVDIAISNIQEGTPEKAVRIYKDALPGITDELIMSILKYETVIYTTGDAEVSLTNSELVKQQMIDLGLTITNWDNWLKEKLGFIEEIVNGIYRHRDVFNRKSFDDILNVDLSNYDMHQDFDSEDKKIGCEISIVNICARVIAGNPFSNLFDSGERRYEQFCSKCEDEDGYADKEEHALYRTVCYVVCMRNLCAEYEKLYKSYEFLLDNGFVHKPACIEQLAERVFYLLLEFSEKANYNHPMCNEQIEHFKEHIKEIVPLSRMGIEFSKYHIIEKDITDGYDAGYIAPDGTYYGANGSTSSMIHMNIADRLFEYKFHDEMVADGVRSAGYGGVDPEQWLNDAGYMKIHHNEVYAYFAHSKDDTDRKLYCPTKEQIEKICAYADKWWNGKIYTSPQIVGKTEPVTTFKLKQMDEFKLHDIFSV